MDETKTMVQMRMEAAIRGATRFQGVPCRKCGGTSRYVSNGQCCACLLRNVQKARKRFATAKRKAEKSA